VLDFLFGDRQPPRRLLLDMHSHLIPGVDDGVKTNEESFAVIEELISLGYRKIVTTPHIMSDYFGNTLESLTLAYSKFLPALQARGYSISFELAAEYYMDEMLIESVNAKSPLLTFGDRHFLFETNAVSEPLQLKEFIFLLTSQGYKPILAHPERYQYMTLDKAEDLRHRGVLLQVNLLSLLGYYGPPMQKLAEKFIDRGWVDLLGTDCHNIDQIPFLQKVQQLKYYRKAVQLPLLNFTL
jgi:protein-tyrosine phosphatase